MPTGTDQWILLRGLTREARHWGNLPGILAKTLPHADILALDTPGNGRLNHMQSPSRVEDMMEACRTLLRDRGLAPPYSLLSLSLGSMIATAWAHAYPAELRCSVMMNTSLRPFCAFYQRLRPANYPTMISHVLFGNDESMETMILRITSSRADPSVLPAWVAYRHDHPVSTRNAIRQLFAAARYRAPNTAPPVRMLLLSGAADRLVSSRCSRAIAERWHLPLRIHPSAGHDLPLDAGPWVAEQIADWLASP